MSEITLLLDAIARGESRASEDLLPLIYDELRRLAAAHGVGQASRLSPFIKFAPPFGGRIHRAKQLMPDSNSKFVF